MIRRRRRKDEGGMEGIGKRGLIKRGRKKRGD
jgi:hypothetical protein